jgi:hypothetical protein
LLQPSPPLAAARSPNATLFAARSGGRTRRRGGYNRRSRHRYR